MLNVKGGFGKWSIGICDNGEIVVEFEQHPNYGVITLHDSSVNDLQKIGKSFLKAAIKLKIKK